MKCPVLYLRRYTPFPYKWIRSAIPEQIMHKIVSSKTNTELSVKRAVNSQWCGKQKNVNCSHASPGLYNHITWLMNYFQILFSYIIAFNKLFLLSKRFHSLS